MSVSATTARVINRTIDGIKVKDDHGSVYTVPYGNIHELLRPRLATGDIVNVAYDGVKHIIMEQLG